MSESLEMYLVTVAQWQENTGEERISLTQLAKAMGLQPVSVHQMVNKIVRQGLLRYRPYKGVSLTEKGWQKAQRILRKRRLWQVFLVHHLGLSPEEADQVSCRLEHITPDHVAERLAEFLGHPTLSPLGKPIPPSEGMVRAVESIRLSALGAGQRGKVTAIYAEPSVRAFLTTQGLRPGVEVVVWAVADNGMMLLDVNRRRFSLAGEVADKVAVEPIEEAANPQSKTLKEEVPMSSVEQRPLSELEPGQKGIVVRVTAQGALKKRLLDMGFVHGEEVVVERKAPLGDPVEFQIKGYHLSLRKKEAMHVIVEVTS